MKKVFITMSVLALCFMACKKEVKTETTSEVTDTTAVKTEEPIAEQPLDSATKMKLWMEYATPGEPHKMLADEVGTWNCEMTYWEGPDGKMEKSTSVADIKMILGGR